MACPQPPYNPFALAFEYDPDFPTLIGVSGPELFLSNNPESVANPRRAHHISERPRLLRQNRTPTRAFPR